MLVNIIVYLRSETRQGGQDLQNLLTLKSLDLVQIICRSQAVKFPWYTCSRVAEAFKDIFEIEEPPNCIEALKRINNRLPQDNEQDDEYCLDCGQDGPLHREMKSTEFDIRGETLHIEYPAKTCLSCGTSELEAGMLPAEIAFVQYRKDKGLLTPKQMKEIRKRHSLSQKSFAALLGISEATINCYEGGGLQDVDHDRAIKKLDARLQQDNEQDKDG